jgi:integrase
MAGSNILSAAFVAKVKDPGRYGDGGGLYLQVKPGGTKSWLFRFQLRGRSRQMGLGPADIVGLAEARERARDCRRTLLEGVDPIESRRRARSAELAAADNAITFDECAERYIAAREDSWRNAKHRAQWRSTIDTYCAPINNLDVSAVDLRLVLGCIEPIWKEKTETASRVRGRIEAVLDWAAARGYRQGDNPARWKGLLDKIVPPRRQLARVRHHPALPYTEIPEFMDALRTRQGASARALEFAILTAARTGEVLGARWSELDLKAGTWTVPAHRMKGGREHRVPLSERAAAILRDLPREAVGRNGFVFIGLGTGRALSNMALLALLERMRREELTTHGFRSTFRDWAAEATGYPNHVVEMALAHAVAGGVEAAYRRGDLFAKRGRLMIDWGRYCEQPISGSSNVVHIRGPSS